MKAVRESAPRSIRPSLYSHSPVSSGERSSSIPRPLSRVISEKAFGGRNQLAAFA